MSDCKVHNKPAPYLQAHAARLLALASEQPCIGQSMHQWQHLHAVIEQQASKYHT